MNLGPKGLKLIKSYEKLRLRAYNTDGAGVWTIGWGHTGTVDGKPIRRGMKITKAKADELFRKDLAWAERAVRSKVRVDVSQEQYDAMVSLCYNIGAAGFGRSSVLRHTNARRWSRAARAFGLWNKGGGRVLLGLVRRRADEAKLYSEGIPGVEVADAHGIEIEADRGKRMIKSRTAWVGGSQALGGVAMATSYATEIKSNVALMFEGQDFNYAWVWGGVAVVLLIAGGAWVLYDRHNKSVEDGV